jgi:hypothetical protein
MKIAQNAYVEIYESQESIHQRLQIFLFLLFSCFALSQLLITIVIITINIIYV